MEYGKRLNPERSLRTPKGIEGIRQKVIVTHNSSMIDQNQDLLVRLPNLGCDEIIIPGMANLSFNIELTSTSDPNRTLVSSIGRAIIKKLAAKFKENEILSIDNYDVFACYQELWKTKPEKKNAIRQGIISTNGDLTPNCMKLRINAGDKSTTPTKDNAVAETYGSKFIIPLDFEMLDSAMPYYQVRLRNRLSYELKFNDYNRVINSSKTGATYKITDISLEYDIVTQPELARSIRSEYDKMVLLYDRVIQHSQIPVNKSDTKWNWSFNDTCKSLKGILVLFEEGKPYVRDTSKFYNPKIQNVTVTIERKPNQLYSQGMRSFEQCDEACKYFAEGRLANEVQKQLQLYDLSLGEYLVNKYALWLDFRTTDENELHRTGRQIGNTSRENQHTSQEESRLRLSRLTST